MPDQREKQQWIDLLFLTDTQYIVKIIDRVTHPRDVSGGIKCCRSCGCDDVCRANHRRIVATNGTEKYCQLIGGKGVGLVLVKQINVSEGESLYQKDSSS